MELLCNDTMLDPNMDLRHVVLICHHLYLPETFNTLLISVDLASFKILDFLTEMSTFHALSSELNLFIVKRLGRGMGMGMGMESQEVTV